jgi:hypothetical protein
MKTKLTLRLDPQLKRQLKKVSKEEKGSDSVCRCEEARFLVGPTSLR